MIRGQPHNFLLAYFKMNASAIKNSTYLSIGFFLSHLFHAITYWSQGGKNLATWLTNFSHGSSAAFTLSVPLALFLAACLSAFSLVVGIILNREFDRRPINRTLNLSISVLFMLIISSQAITSSVLRILYETGFVFVFMASMIVQKVFLPPAKEAPLNKELYERLWDLLKLSIPLVLGFSAIFGGVGAISSFYDTPQEFIHRQMYRHLYLTIYFVLGMGLFVMYPIFRQILTMHLKIYEKTKNSQPVTSAGVKKTAAD